ncbi:hybrid sensor histidine kinase/response regulator [Stutzerimonas tarimensis]|uniref:histidine kinase n=1 Tax=Stutzerimonas tarimensis TaxID=1507735 RepID=A0ABV7T5T6_9GAMM
MRHGPRGEASRPCQQGQADRSAEQARVHEEPDYQRLFEAILSPCLVLAVDDDFTMVAANEARLQITGTRREDIIGRPLFEVFGHNPDDANDYGASVLRASLERVLKTGRADRMAVTRYDIRRPDHQGGGFEPRYWRPLNAPVHDRHGQVRYVLHQVEDVTERMLESQEAEVERQSMDERLRAALLASGTGTFRWNLVTGALYVDSALARIFGLTEEEQIGSVEHFIAQVHPADRSAVREQLGRSANGEPLATEFRLEGQTTTCWIAANGHVFHDAHGQPAYLAGACTDITSRKKAEHALRELNETLEARVAEAVAEHQRAEDALRQAQKMEAVGQLTGGLAHDFNNLLTGITASLDLLQLKLAQGEIAGLQRYAQEARNACNRAAALTHRLLTFSRHQPAQTERVAINALVEGMTELIRRTLGSDIELRLNLVDPLPVVQADPHQLENALLNLCLNARDALEPTGGRIDITTFVTRLDGAGAGQLNLPVGRYVSLRVSDNGRGMPPEMLSKVFEPFFTTKPPGAGSGLGLPMTYNFARQAGGQVEVTSTPGHGTEVTLHLPDASDAP